MEGDHDFSDWQLEESVKVSWSHCSFNKAGSGGLNVSHVAAYLVFELPA